MLTQAQSELWTPDEESSRYPADEPNVCSNGVLVITDPLTGYGFCAIMYSQFPLFGRKQVENGMVLLPHSRTHGASQKKKGLYPGRIRRIHGCPRLRARDM